MSDNISRQAVIQLIYNSYYNLAESSEDVDSMIEDVEALPAAEPKIHDDGTLEVSVSDALKVKRVLVGDAHQWGGFYYPDEE